MRVDQLADLAQALELMPHFLDAGEESPGRVARVVEVEGGPGSLGVDRQGERAHSGLVLFGFAVIVRAR